MITEEQIKQINDAKRFSARMSQHYIDFIIAEEMFLIQMGWELIKVDQSLSYWKCSQHRDTYSRNQAILIEKANNKNLGLW